MYDGGAAYLDCEAHGCADGAPIVTQADLVTFPGVGVNTAGGMMN